MKLGLVGAILLLTVARDLLHGSCKQNTGYSSKRQMVMNQVIIHTSSWVPRVALVVTLLVLAAAVLLTRS